MKTFPLIRSIALASCALSGLALAAGETPLLTKTNSPGFSPQAWRVFNTCNVFPGRIEIMRGVDTLSLSETRKVTFDANAVKKLISAARGGTIVKGVGPTDIQTTTWLAHAPGSTSNGDEGNVMLAQFGQFNEENKAEGALQLKNFLDEVCATGTFAPTNTSVSL